MLHTIWARVTSIEREEIGIIFGIAQNKDQNQDGKTRKIIAYTDLVGKISVGDSVLLNTTATDLNLGTGGYDFVIAVNIDTDNANSIIDRLDNPDAHIIKLRYTPHQIAIEAAEMQPEFAQMPENLEGIPVIVCGLHSQIAPAVAAIKTQNPTLRIAYLMTDAAALPIAFSNLVRQLKKAKLIDVTITTGQAFGGDLEAVTVPSALLIAASLADVIIVSQGPGNAGTGTKYGFSGIEQATICQVASVLGGTVIGVLRLSRADPRSRHLGLSHHSVTVFGELTTQPVHLALPPSYAIPLPDNIAQRHTIHRLAEPVWQEILTQNGIILTSMGRKIHEDPLFFAAAAVAGGFVTSLSPESRHLRQDIGP